MRFKPTERFIEGIEARIPCNEAVSAKLTFNLPKIATCSTCSLKSSTQSDVHIPLTPPSALPIPRYRTVPL